MTISEPVAELVSTTNSASYSVGSYTPSDNSLQVCVALCRGTVGSGVPAANWLSGSFSEWILHSKSTFNGGADSIFLFYVRVQGSRSASGVQVFTGSDAATGCIAYVFQATGAVTWGNPFRQVKFNSGTSTNAKSGSLTQSVLSGNGCIAAWMGGLSSSNPANVSTPPTSWTEIGDNGFGTPTSNGTGAYRSSGETGSSIAFTNASTTWGLVFAEIINDGQAEPRQPFRNQLVYSAAIVN